MRLPRKTELALQGLLQEAKGNDHQFFLQFVEVMRIAGPSSRPGMVAALLHALQSSEPLVRRRAALAFWLVYYLDVMPTLLNAMDDSDVDECQLYATAREQIGGKATVEGLCGLLEDSNSEVRMSAIRTLAIVKAGEAVAPLLVMLHDPDPRVRSEVAWGLGQFEEKAALSGLIEAMQIRMQMSDSKRSCPYVDYVAPVIWRRWKDRLLPCRTRIEPAVSSLWFMRRLWQELMVQWVSSWCYCVTRTVRFAGKRHVCLVLSETRPHWNNCWPHFESEGVAEVRRTICWALGEIATATIKAAQSAAEAARSRLEARSIGMSRVCDGDPSVIVRVQAIQVLEKLEAENNTEPEAGNPSDPLQPNKKMLQKTMLYEAVVYLLPCRGDSEGVPERDLRDCMDDEAVARAKSFHPLHRLFEIN